MAAAGTPRVPTVKDKARQSRLAKLADGNSIREVDLDQWIPIPSPDLVELRELGSGGSETVRGIPRTYGDPDPRSQP